MNIYDIAAKAHVSISSVSRYFNHPEQLSEKTRNSITSALEESSFVPNQNARTLVGSSAKSIGIMMSNIQHQRFSTIAYYLERSFFEYGYNTFFCNTNDDWRKIEQYIEMLASKRVDAIILIGSMFGNFDMKLLQTYLPNIPIITTDVRLDLPNSYSVTPDHEFGMRAAVKHLIDRNHKNLAFVACTGSINTKNKINAFYQAITDYGLKIFGDDNILRISLASSEDPNLDIAAIVKSTNIPYTGLIFSTDIMAARAISSFRHHGYDIPKDYAVIGYDNSPYALCCQPTLTSIDTHPKTIARVIANLIHDIFNEREVGNDVIIKPSLMIRSST